ncbi:MAG: peptidase M28 family protein, partial [Deltaproteobacteria bacterium]|nr:peptidase M28 family protein [Deltaproteobacteria bacterium]
MNVRSLTLLGLLSLSLPALAGAAKKPRPIPVPDKETVARHLIGGALTDGHAFELLRELTDHIGPRLSGSPGAQQAVLWAMARAQEDGLSVRTEKAMVPHWVRGEEKAQIVSLPAPKGLEQLTGARWPPEPYQLAITALGGSKPTPAGGVEGDVVEVGSLADIRALGERAKGKIVFVNHDMSVAADYGRLASLRTKGPYEAGKLGAVGTLVRSLASASMRSPHTGATSLLPEASPSAALSTEDAEHLHRLLQLGPVRVHLTLGCQTLPDVESANVVMELPGREL